MPRTENSEALHANCNETDAWRERQAIPPEVFMRAQLFFGGAVCLCSCLGHLRSHIADVGLHRFDCLLGCFALLLIPGADVADCRFKECYCVFRAGWRIFAQFLN